MKILNSRQYRDSNNVVHTFGYNKYHKDMELGNGIQRNKENR